MTIDVQLLNLCEWGRRNHALDDSMRMYIGLDVHKNYLQAPVLDAEGQLVKQQRINNSKEEITNFFQPYNKAKAVIESSTTWHPIYQLLSGQHEITLSNPTKTKAIAQAGCADGAEFVNGFINWCLDDGDGQAAYAADLRSACQIP